MQAEVDLRQDLEARTGPLVAQVYCPFLWRPHATGWYTLKALASRTLVLTDRREWEQEWPWPSKFLVEWDFAGASPAALEDVSVFHLQNGWTATSRGLELIERFPGKRFVATFIGTDVNRHARLEGNGEKYRRVFEALDAAVVPCEFLARKLEALGCEEAKIRVIPPGVDPLVLLPKEQAAFSPCGSLRVCALARMIELKGLDVAVEAAGLAAEKADVTLDVVGEGPERDRLATLADEVNSRHRRKVVTLHGDGESMPPHPYALEVLKQSDCLVNCSRPMPDGAEETMSVAMIEAQMAGLPVVAFLCGGAAEIVEHDRTGWLATFPDDQRGGDYEEATAEGLAGALVRLAEVRDQRIELGEAAAKRARKLFSTAVVAASYDRLYGEIAGP